MNGYYIPLTLLIHQRSRIILDYKKDIMTLTTPPILEILNNHIRSFDFNNMEAMRIFHGRGHVFDGLNFINIDWFSPVIWVVVYGEPDIQMLESIKTSLRSFGESHCQVKAVLFQQRSQGKSQQECLYGQLPDTVHAHEQGARYELELTHNQNIGFFLDAKPARQWLRKHAGGAKVLNMFAYTCSFSVAAIQGGAKHVVNIDMAKGPIAQGQRNHDLNGMMDDRSSFLPHDIFRSMRNLEKRGPYDFIVIDPPSRQKKSFEANKDYLRLLRKLPPLLHAKTVILALLNAPYLDDHFLPKLFAEALPHYDYCERLSQRNDFPEQDLSRCLKMQVFTPKNHLDTSALHL